MATADGPVDVWINNAGLDHPRAMIWNLDPKDIKKVLDVNIFGSIAGTRTAVRGMKSQTGDAGPHPGIIYLMEGMGSDGMVQPGVSIYGTSKAAVRYLYRALRSELKKEGSPVRIGVISPGIVVTDLLTRGLPEDESEAAPAKRIFNILADTPDTVSAFIARRIISTAPEKVTWLTGTKIAWRFATAWLRHRRLFQ
jgi:NAD(P)-dependent dehydrogenase (short-subunit alcohol dehydrogenase family)